jgi:hypothetical protein
MTGNVIITSAIILVSLGLLATYYSQYTNTDTIEMTDNGIRYKLKKNIPLYVYSSVPKSSRKWNSFYDRTHTEPRSDILQLCDNTHSKHHSIGKIIHITDEDLIKMCPMLNNTNSTDIASLLQYNRVVRDILLLSLVCKTGGIVIPRNTFLMNGTELLYTQAREPGTILYSGSGNNSYSCPVIVSTGSCDELANVLLKETQNNTLRGGIDFKGGLPVILENTKKLYSRLGNLSGVNELDTTDITEIGEYSGRDLVIRIPFPQASGVNTIPRKDEWIYSTNVEDLLMNPTVLKSIVSQACDNHMNIFIEKEAVL